MEITYAVRYSPQVVIEDIPLLPKAWKLQVQRAIEEKLTTAPAVYGKPLRRSLHGYRKLRVGDYRVVFLIEKQTVYVFAILHRSIVYKQVSQRV